jgi:predicted dehydrogenase
MHHVVVIGVGSIGERHVRCFQSTGRAEVSLVEIHAPLREAVAERYGVRAFESIAAALTGHPTAAVIAAPAPAHIPLSLELATAGIHLLIEKPLSTSLERIDELQSLVTARCVIAGVAYVCRAYPALVFMKQAIDAGRVGTPLEIVAVCGQHFPTYRPAYREIYYARRESGGGAIQDALTHVVNAGEWLVGPVTGLFADAAHCALADVEVEDTVHLLTRHAKCLGSYSLNQHQAPNEMTVTVVGEQGTIRWETHQNRLLSMNRPGDSWRIEEFNAMERDTPFILQAHAFLDAIEGRREVPCRLDEGLQTLRVNLAALVSADSHTWQAVEPRC